MRNFVPALLLSLTAACGAPAPAPAQTPAPVAAAATLVVEAPWAAPTPGGVDVSAGYLTIVNGAGVEDRLVAVASPRAARVELHEMSMEGGVMRMRAMDGLAVPSGGRIALEPGGRHLMFFGVTEPFVVGEDIPVTLTFERAGSIEMTLPVRARAAGHSGH